MTDHGPFPTPEHAVGEDDAKQGRVGMPILAVLVVSVVLVVLAFAALYAVNAHRTTDSTRSDAAARVAAGARTAR